MRVAALFVDVAGVYSEMSGIDCWDKVRDARKYQGPFPVVAHPPCQLWGKFALINFIRWGGEHNRPGNDGGCFESALASVRAHGGVLEHPADSKAWTRYKIPRPINCGWNKISANEYVCEVWQSAYGHLARKRTWLFCKSAQYPAPLNWDRPKGIFQIGGYDSSRARKVNLPSLQGKAASATPIAFAHTLISLAQKSIEINALEGLF